MRRRPALAIAPHQCNLRFEMENFNHQKVSHRKRKCHICRFCEKRYSSINRLKVHENQHKVNGSGSRKHGANCPSQAYRHRNTTPTYALKRQLELPESLSRLIGQYRKRLRDLETFHRVIRNRSRRKSGFNTASSLQSKWVVTNVVDDTNPLKNIASDIPATEDVIAIKLVDDESTIAQKGVVERETTLARKDFVVIGPGENINSTAYHSKNALVEEVLKSVQRFRSLFIENPFLSNLELPPPSSTSTDRHLESNKDLLSKRNVHRAKELDHEQTYGSPCHQAVRYSLEGTGHGLRRVVAATTATTYSLEPVHITQAQNSDVGHIIKNTDVAVDRPPAQLESKTPGTGYISQQGNGFTDESVVVLHDQPSLVRTSRRIVSNLRQNHPSDKFLVVPRSKTDDSHAISLLSNSGNDAGDGRSNHCENYFIGSISEQCQNQQSIVSRSQPEDGVPVDLPDEVVNCPSGFVADSRFIESSNEWSSRCQDQPPIALRAQPEVLSANSRPNLHDRELSVKSGKPLEINQAIQTFNPSSDIVSADLNSRVSAIFRESTVTNRENRRKCPVRTQLVAVYRNRIAGKEKSANAECNSEPIECDICHKKFDTKEQFEAHFREHSPGNRFQCNICQSSFKRNQKLERHLPMHTSNTNKHKCSLYGFTSCQVKSLERHLIAAHPDAGQIVIAKGEFECSICHKRLRSKLGLEVHLRVHSGERPFSCGVCRASFSDKGNLSTHLKIHNRNDNIYKCPLCELSLPRKSLRMHLKAAHTEEERDSDFMKSHFKCGVCHKVCRSKTHLEEHLRVHSGERPFSCEICEVSFRQKSALNVHLDMHTRNDNKQTKIHKCPLCELSLPMKSLRLHLKAAHPEEGERIISDEGFMKSHFKCGVCHKVFQYKSHLEQHLQIHSEERPFSCEICKASFRQKILLRTHLKNHNRNVRKDNCPLCELSLPRKSLRLHLKAAHPEEAERIISDSDFMKSYVKCDVCQKVFQNKYHLEEHLRIHFGERPFSCEICKASFRVKSVLNTHLEMHIRNDNEQTKIHKCPSCELNLPMKSLKRHVMVAHPGEVKMENAKTRFECNICKKKFDYKSHLKTHLRVHSGERPFKCKICKADFKQNGTLQRHFLLHTRVGID